MFYEVEFAMPFETLYDNFMESERTYSKNFIKLLNVLSISFDFTWIDEHYENRERGNGDVHVFYSPTKQEFIMLDLYFGLTDQSDMIVFGVHVQSSKEQQVKEIMQQIHDAAFPKSSFDEYHNNKLFDEIDSSLYPRKCELTFQDIVYYN